MSLALEFSERAWSPYQRDVFAAVEGHRGHIQVEALAGSGKTTTVVEAIRYLAPGERALLCAFNSSVAAELAARTAGLPVECATLHALGYRAILAARKGVKTDSKAGRRAMERSVPEGTDRDVVAKLARVASMAKSRLATTPQGVIGVGLSIGELDCWADADKAAEAAQWVLAAMRAGFRGVEIDFDDQVFVPAALGRPIGNYSTVFVDETQDMSAAQLKLATLALAPGGRLVLVGDRRQAIYGWRGADVGGMPRMAAELGAKILPLSISYRCPKSVAELARRVVPAFEVPQTAPEGSIERAHETVAELAWKPGDAVLSRVNAPLVKHCLRCLVREIPARIQGKDIAAGLLAKLASFRCFSTAELIRSVEQWRADELDALTDEQEEAAERVRDQAETLIALCEGLKTVADVKRRLENMFSDSDSKAVVFSSVHRAKGLEWDRVFLLASTFRPSRSEEEENLWYVAVTRTKLELVLVGESRDPIVSSAIRGATEIDNVE